MSRKKAEDLPVPRYGSVIRKWRLGMSKPREFVAVRLGVSLSTVARWELNRSSMSIEHVLECEKLQKGLVSMLLKAAASPSGGKAKADASAEEDSNAAA